MTRVFILDLVEKVRLFLLSKGYILNSKAAYNLTFNREPSEVQELYDALVSHWSVYEPMLLELKAIEKKNNVVRSRRVRRS